jgi:hypothetical protein
MFIFPNISLASTISASSSGSIFAGDTAIIDVYLNTENQTINSIDGSILLRDENGGNFEVKDISLVNSAFTMWPRKPSLEDDYKIYFVGGVPGGVKSDRALLFRVIVKINQSGTFTIKPNGLLAYVNDGLGTEVKIIKDSSSISVGESKGEPKDLWLETISNDNVPPEPFTIKIIQDENLFDGRRFAYFETTDSSSGIDYYEIREGSNPSVRTGTSYVIISEEKKVELIVTAHDKAGNFRVATLNKKDPINWISVLVSVLVIFVGVKIVKIIRRRRRKNA